MPRPAWELDRLEQAEQPGHDSAGDHTAADEKQRGRSERDRKQCRGDGRRVRVGLPPDDDGADELPHGQGGGQDDEGADDSLGHGFLLKLIGYAQRQLGTYPTRRGRFPAHPGRSPGWLSRDSG